MNYGELNTFYKIFFADLEPQAVEEDDGVVAASTKKLLRLFTNGDPVVGLDGDYDAYRVGVREIAPMKILYLGSFLEIRPS